MSTLLDLFKRTYNKNLEKTEALIAFDKKCSGTIRKILGEEAYIRYWIGQPHLRSQIILYGKISTKALPFDESSLFLDMSLKGIPYIKTPYEPNSNVHLGQRKLLISEIYFLTNFGHLSNTVVYAGAADGLHIPLLCEMYKDKHFYLYDPSPFSASTLTYAKRNPDRLTICNSLFPPENMEEFEQIISNGFIFISDIRSKSPDLSHPAEEDVEFDMDLQKNWVKKLKPFASCLKLRFAYLNSEDEDKLVPYIGGLIYKQPWAPQHSTETRLISLLEDIEGPDILYSSRRYESILFEHNVKLRPHIYRLTQRVNIP